MGNETTNDLLTRVEPLVIAIVDQRLRGFPDEIKDEVCQACRVALWRRVIPKYDPSRRLEPFVQRCLDRVIVDELRKLTSGPRPCQLAENEDRITDDSDDLDLPTVESLLTDPKLSKAARRLLAALIDSPDRQAVADRLNIPVQLAYERISRLKRQIKSRLARCA